MYMANLWVTFSTDSSGTFTELSGNIIYNVNNSYNFNGNLVDTTSNFIIYELTNNPIRTDVSLQANNWKKLNLNTILNPFQGYWLGGINTKLPEIFTTTEELNSALNIWGIKPILISNLYGSIENWDVGNVTNMSQMFNVATNFNQDISNWNVGNVTNMSHMFTGASNFNQDISNWDVGNVTNMSQMFRGASNFNQDISNWNAGNVTNANLVGMFENVSFFTNMNEKIHANGN